MLGGGGQKLWICLCLGRVADLLFEKLCYPGERCQEETWEMAERTVIWWDVKIATFERIILLMTGKEWMLELKPLGIAALGVCLPGWALPSWHCRCSVQDLGTALGQCPSLCTPCSELQDALLEQGWTGGHRAPAPVLLSPGGTSLRWAQSQALLLCDLITNFNCCCLQLNSLSVTVQSIRRVWSLKPDQCLCLL